MAISNELSSEIAAAILVEKKSPKELNQLKDVILRVHSTLQKMSEDERTARAEDRNKRGSSQEKAGST
jgi:predicted transcriptional regulator